MSVIPSTVDAILARLALDGPATLLAHQGKASVAWGTPRHVIKIAHPEQRAQVAREAQAATLARAAGVRTPALVASAQEDGHAYSVWERVEGPLLSARRHDAEAWRAIGRSLARLHAVADVGDAAAVLVGIDKNDAAAAATHLASLAGANADRLGPLLERCRHARSAAPRLVHFDVHDDNVVCAADGPTLIDWGDAGFVDPACDFAPLPIARVDDVLDGYEALGGLAALGDDYGARIVRGLIGFAARKAAHWPEPLDDILAWLDRGAPGRLRAWIL